jgi:uncharacterized cupin superfamily protein
MKHQISMSAFSWRKAIFAIGFIGWSAAMFLVGGISSDFGISRSQAAMVTPLIRLDHDRLSGNNLGEFTAYEPEFGDLMARGHEYFYSEDGNFGLGVWESKPGETTYTDLEYDELMYVLDGAIVMTDEHGNSERYAAGEGVVLPKGFTGTLGVPDGGVRKIWVTYMGGKKKQAFAPSDSGFAELHAIQP